MRCKSDEASVLWQKTVEACSADGYSNAARKFTEAWADMMEQRLDADPTLTVQDIAQSTSREADTQGITGAMYGWSVGCLAELWVYGEELRRWHNLNLSPTQGAMANEKPGCVLNPAVVVIG